jgi:hypothetical protein
MRAAAILLLVGLTCGDVAHATVYAPMDEATLAGASPAIVSGNVLSSGPRRIPGGIVTDTAVAVDHVYKGEVGTMVVTVTTPGGRVGDDSVVVYGMPSFAVGEDVLLYLQQTSDGDLRPTAFALGAYRVTTAVDGSPLAVQMAPTGETRRLDEVVATVQAMNDPGSRVSSAQDTATPTSARFTMLGTPPGRWFQPDNGQPVRLALANSDAKLGQAVSNAIIDAALGAWTNVPTASIVLQRSGTASPGPSIAKGTCDDRSVMQFNDPANEIPALVQCSGVLAVGGFCSKPGAPMTTVNGTTFQKISEGDLTMADGLGDCLQRKGYEEIVTHEVGHVIGLGHSSEDPNERNPDLENATMYFLAHLDGRGATLMADDIAGVTFIYPVENDPLDLDGDGVKNDDDACPSTPVGAPVDATGCSCQDDGRAPCDDGLFCTQDLCNPSSGGCSTKPIDCTGGDPCLTDSCTEEDGCATAPVAGNGAVLCVYQRPYPPPACAGERVPASVRKLLRKASRLVTSGITRNDPKFFEKADKKLERARKAIDHAATRRKKPQSAVCASALGALVDDARARLPLAAAITN